MSSSISSQPAQINSFAASDTLTLAEVVRRLRLMPGLERGERDRLISAVNLAARALDLPADSVPAHSAFLGQHLAKVSPAALDVTPAHLANSKSRLRKALRLAGVDVLPGRYMAPLSPAWTALRGRIAKRSTRLGLSRLMHFSSAQGIEPDAVDDAFSERLRQALATEGLVKDPYRIWRDALTCWNRAVAEVPGWPQRLLSVPPVAQRYGLEMDTFPPSLGTEVEALLEWLRTGGGGFLGGASFRPLRPTTLKERRAQIRQVASALVARGRDPATIRGLADLVEPAAVKEVLRFFHARAKGRVTGRMQVLAWVLLGFARHWVKAPPDQLQELQAIARECDPKVSGPTPKNRDVLRRFRSREAKRRLAELAFTLLAEIKAKPPWSGRDALKAQTALMVQLLLRAPMWVGNLRNLRLDRHVLRHGPESAQVVLVIPGEEVKNRQELVYPLLGVTRDLWRLYLEHARPQLVGGPSPFLFPAGNGEQGAKSTRAIEHQIAKVSFRHLGVRLTPHQYRHLAGKLILDARPGAHEVVRALLGDRSIATITRYYAGLEQETAVEHFDALIDELLQDAAGRGGKGR